MTHTRFRFSRVPPVKFPFHNNMGLQSDLEATQVEVAMAPRGLVFGNKRQPDIRALAIGQERQKRISPYGAVKNMGGQPSKSGRQSITGIANASGNAGNTPALRPYQLHMAAFAVNVPASTWTLVLPSNTNRLYMALANNIGVRILFSFRNSGFGIPLGANSAWKDDASVSIDDVYVFSPIAGQIVAFEGTRALDGNQ